MSGCITFIRWLLSIPLILLLIIFVAAGILLSSLSLVVANRENLKYWIKTSGIYDNAKQTAISLMLSSDSGSQNNKLQTNDGGTQKSPGENDFFPELGRQLQNPNDPLTILVDKIASPKFLEKSVNKIIDGYYNWFDGETMTPEYDIALVDNKEDAINLLKVLYTEKAKSLPACAEGINIPAGFDPLSAPCWPAGMDFAEVNRYIDANAGRPEMQYIQDNVKLTSQGAEVSAHETYAVQMIFLVIRLFPLIFLLLTGLLTFLITVAIPGFKNGYYLSAIIIFLLSVVWIALAVLLMTSADNLLKRGLAGLGSNQAAIIEPFASRIYSNITSQFGQLVIVHSMVLIFLSLVPLVFNFVKKKLAAADGAAV